MKKIAFLIIGTGKYLKLAQDCAASIQEHLYIRDSVVTPYIFTDNAEAVEHGSASYEVRFCPHLPWPLITLLRYDLFWKFREELADFDYIYYIDADMRLASQVGPEILGTHVRVKHPGFYQSPAAICTYERNEVSKAFVPFGGEPTNYYIGAFQGGKALPFLEMCRELRSRVNSDLSRNFIACWHDESHMNCYAKDYPPDVVLNPGFCYPEGWDLPFEKKIVAISKDQGAIRHEE